MKMTITEWLAVAAIIIQVVGILIQVILAKKNQPSPPDKSPHPFVSQGAKDFFRSKLAMLGFSLVGALLVYSELHSVVAITQAIVFWVSVGTVMVSFGTTSLFWLLVLEDVLRPKNR